MALHHHISHPGSIKPTLSQHTLFVRAYLLSASYFIFAGKQIKCGMLTLVSYSLSLTSGNIWLVELEAHIFLGRRRQSTRKHGILEIYRDRYMHTMYTTNKHTRAHICCTHTIHSLAYACEQHHPQNTQRDTTSNIAHHYCNAHQCSQK